MKKLVLGLALLALGLGTGLSGTAVRAQELQLPTITVEPDSYDFGNVPLNAVASAYIRVNNTGDAPLIVSDVKTKAPFADNSTSFTVQPHSFRKVMISFIPTALGVANGFCTISSNAHNAPTVYVPLSGTGVE